MKKFIQYLVLACMCLLTANAVQGQLADVTYTTRTLSVWSYENATGGACWESGTEEYAAYVGAWDNVNGAAGSTGCQTCSNNGNCTYAFGINLNTRSNNAYTILSNIDAWENDCSSNCSYNSCGLFGSLSDDCRRQQTASYPFREYSYPTNGTYTSGPIWGSTGDHRWALETTWRYSGTASLLNPACAVQTASYTAGGIRSWSVNLVAGISYNFNNCSSPSSDTYLRLFAPDGFSLVGSGDDNCGVLSIVNYTAAVTGTYYLEVSQYSRGPVSSSGILSYNITSLPANNACATAIAVTPGSSTNFNTTCATQDAPGQSCGTGTHNDIWYTFTPTASGNMTAANCAQNAYDSRISVYSGTCGALVLIGCSDDACGTSSSVAATVCKNVTYYISVGGYNGQTGAGAFALSFTASNTLPAISCPANISVNTGAGVCTATVNYSTPVGTDNCPGTTTALIAGLASGSAFPLGVTTNTFRVTDSDAATAQCTFTVTVTDNQNPTINCPAALTVGTNTTSCDATLASPGTPTTSDNCSVASLTHNHPSTSYPLGATTVTWTVTDASGRTATCNRVITVIDNVNPSITCPPNLAVNATAGVCTTEVGSIGFPAFSDNCTLASLTYNHLSPTYNVGVTTVTWTLIDAAGNVGTCNHTVTVTDNQIPAITCPANVSVNTGTGLCGAIVTYSTPAGTDNCAVTTGQTSGFASGTTFPVGTTTNTFVATDGGGNTANCSFSVVVTDNEAPVINCPATINVGTDLGMCNAVVTFTTPAGTDNCTATTSQTAGQASGATYPVGTTTNAFSTSDAAGNTANCSFSIVVSDNEAPAMTCPANINVGTDLGLCNAIVAYTAPAGTDNCAATTSQTAGLAGGATYPVGTTTNTFSALDAAGNTTTCSFNIVVTDNEAPVITCPANVAAGNDPILCSKVVTFTDPLGTDNCGATTLQTAGLANGAAYPVGTTTNTYVATDAAGNTATCTFSILISDIELPVISCPANITVGTDVGVCDAVVSYSTPAGTDNCAATTTQTSGLASGATFPVGVTTNTFGAVDAAGNTASCSFSVVVADNEAPVIVCPANITLSASATTCDAVVSWTVPNSTDNCGVSSSSSTHLPGSTFSAGSTTVTYSAVDANANIGTCSFTVTVNDSIAPVAACQGVTVALDASGNGSASASAIDNGSTDNCTLSSMSLDVSAFTCADVGANIVTLTVTDGSGNISTCTATVTVVAPPVAGTLLADTTTCGYNVSCAGGNDGVAHVTGGGGCPSYTYLWSTGATTSTVSGLAAGTYTATITDATGGTQVLSVTLTAPTAIQVSATAISSCADATTGSINITPTGGNDCQGYTFLWSNPGASTTEDVSNLGAGTYTVTVTDANGCTATQTVTVGSFPAVNPAISQSGTTLSSVQSWSSYQWLLNGSPISGATSSSYTATQTGNYSLSVTNANGCTGVSGVLSITVVGITDELGAMVELSIYPNPARGEFRLRPGSPIGHGITVSIHDMYGHLLFAQGLPELEHEVAFDINAFAAGTYIVEVVSEYGERRMFRLVVQ